MKRSVFFTTVILICILGLLPYHAQSKTVKDSLEVTLYGVVKCNGKPVPRVRVTDGQSIVLTNRRGEYSIASDKKYGLVYITTPAGYDVPLENGIFPKFWQRTTLEARERECHDFELVKSDQKEFSIIYCTDIHLCNDPKRRDLEMFRQLQMPAVEKVVEKHKGHPIYTISLGDTTWDRWWYETQFGLDELKQYLRQNKYPTPFYAVMGNHDNDAATPHSATTDFDAARPFREKMGPTFFSFDKGSVHFVMLDNIVYKNEMKPGAKMQKNVAGSRNYDCYVDDAQLEWLRNDLQHVKKQTPIVVCMHAPLRNLDGNLRPVMGHKGPNGQKLIDILKGFDRVEIYSGHHHANVSIRYEEAPNIHENVVSAVCGELWKSLYHSKGNFCMDGTDAGFYVCTYNGKNLVKEFCSQQSDVPFAVYDMNVVKQYYRNGKHAKQLDHMLSLQPKQTNYLEESLENYVYINLFFTDEGTELSVTENGRELDVEKVAHSDPRASVYLHSYTLKNKKRKDATVERRSAVGHMYRVKTSDASSVVTVSVKTKYGKEYTRTISRPLAFSN